MARARHGYGQSPSHLKGRLSSGHKLHVRLCLLVDVLDFSLLRSSFGRNGPLQPAV
jgi:hypothetical protein